MSNDLWPDFNPFPFQGTSTTPSTSAELTDPPSGGVTILLPHVTRGGDLVHDYLRTYDGRLVGRAAMLKGEHGSGKSHTIRHLIERITNGSWQQEGRAPAVKLAVKIVSGDFIAVYQKLLSQLDPDLLRSVALDSKIAFAGRQWLDKASTPAAKGLIADRLRNEKGAAMEALWRYLVDPDAVETDQALELVKAGVGYEDFQRAIPFILSKDKDLAASAYAWLANKPVTVDEMSRLGVSGPIASLDVCVSALQLITILFRRAGRPLIVFLDQCEKLTKEKEATRRQIADNIAVLRELVEIFPENSAFLMVAGTDEAWNRFSDDLQARFRAGLVNVARVDKDQATQVIAAYVDAARPQRTESGIFPFEIGGVDALHRFSRGTLRAFLQAAWVLYKEAEKSRQLIDSSAVDRALAHDLIEPPAKIEDVKAAVQALLQESDLVWRSDFSIDRFVAQYAVVDSDESPILVVQVVSAAFHDDEVRNAQRLVSMIRDWQRTRGTTPRVGMILIGYVSSRVLNVLGTSSVVRTIVFDRATFRADFGALLAAARRVPRSVSSGVGEKKLKAELDRVRGELQSVREQSEGNVDRLERRLQEVLSVAHPILAEPPIIVFERWRDERRGLEKAIETKRAERAGNDLDQLRRGAKRAEQLRTRRLIIPMAVVLTLIALFLAYLRVRAMGMPRRYVDEARAADAARDLASSAMIVGGIAFVIATVGFVLVYLRVSQSSAMQGAAASIESLEELEQLRFKPREAWNHLGDANPQIRYVAWRSMKFDGDPISPRERDLFLRERLSIVRRAAAQAFLPAKLPPPEDLAPLLDVAEFAYVIERGKIDLSSAPRPILLVTRIAEAHNGASYEQAFHLLTSGHAQEVAKAFVDDRVTGVDVIGRQTCRTAISALSPLDDGLGTLDHLECISTVDELFLYFKRELFLGERGVGNKMVG